MGTERRADQIMRRTLREQRESPRQRVCISGMINCEQPQYHDLLALIRDVSSSGVFFYANFPLERGTPPVGADVEITFTLPEPEKRVEVLYRGEVVRVVKYPTGAATGVALRLTEKQAMPRLLERIS